mmetsp:Transcript_521/g.1315  ORF Transcript_521/g.1315 Transcript_521/m.1315 type:complete len:478 (+) Transcript_521:64-1497(+)
MMKHHHHCHCHHRRLLVSTAWSSQLLVVLLSASSFVAVAAFQIPHTALSQRPTTSLSSPITRFSQSDSDNDDGLPPKLPDPLWVCPEHSNICEQTGITLSRYMIEMARVNPELIELESIMTSLSCATKTISHLVKRADLDQLTGYQGNVNIQGEDQKKLDVLTNDVLKKSLEWSGKLATLASEEEDVPVLLDSFGNAVYSGDVIVEEGGEYVAVFDPLDGSSNVDANIPTGTIFGIFKRNEECEIDFESDDITDAEQQCLRDSLQPGENLVAAGYCLYSAATTLVLTIGNGVNIFTLDETIGEYRLTHQNVVIPRRGCVYSMNESNRHDWDKPLLNYINDIQQGKGQSQTKYTARYIGSMVGDIHRTILYGGIFGYPADYKNPNGKLRLLYEAAPMSYIIEQAGGLALTGKSRIMELIPQNVHQRVPCILGSRDDVLELQQYYESSDDPELIARCNSRLQPTKTTAAKEDAEELVSI